MLRVLDLFSGIGGFSLGLERTGGFETIAFCEIDPFCRRVLAKHWPNVRQYEDVRELTAKQLSADGIVPDICGGFPCQDASLGQTNGESASGSTESELDFGETSHVWPLTFDRSSLLENVPGLLSAGFGRVLGDLAAIGFDAEWRCIPASKAGLPHRRDRLWIVAYPRGSRLSRPVEGKSILESAEAALAEHGNAAAGAWRSLDRDLDGLRGGDGVSVAMERRRIADRATPSEILLMGHCRPTTSRAKRWCVMPMRCSRKFRPTRAHRGRRFAAIPCPDAARLIASDARKDLSRSARRHIAWWRGYKTRDEPHTDDQAGILET
jgi:DNA (cytosine-5)-methyltransferase 1